MQNWISKQENEHQKAFYLYIFTVDILDNKKDSFETDFDDFPEISFISILNVEEPKRINDMEPIKSLTWFNIRIYMLDHSLYSLF